MLKALRLFFGDPGSQSVLAVAAMVIGVGTVFYRLIEGLRWLDGLYFSVITLTTVGYGDFSLVTDAGKTFTMFCVFVGFGIFVTLVTEIGSHLVEARKAKNQLR